MNKKWAVKDEYERFFFIVLPYQSPFYFNNFNVNFNVLLSNYTVHPLVKIKKILIKKRFVKNFCGVM
jgi:hypothetical protein